MAHADHSSTVTISSTSLEGITSVTTMTTTLWG